MKKLTVILDAGHGGVVGGKYQTPGKRSPEWGKGVLYEGMFNRWVVNRIIEKLDRKQIPYYHVSPELDDISLGRRIVRANAMYNENPNTYFLSIHANAGGGVGIEGFTTVGETFSDPIGEKILQNLQDDVAGQRFRTDEDDGDLDKERNYYVLKHFRGPAFLLECGFMDSRQDYDNLWDEAYLTKLVDSLVEVIEDLYKNGR